MTPREFKAWFDGFTEAFTGQPTKAQWARIKERVSEIDGQPITERVFVDRYWPSWPIYTYPTVYSAPIRTYATVTAAGNTSNLGGSAGQGVYCSNTSMYALGKAEGLAS